MRSIYSNSKGFTLVELIVGIGLSAIFIISITSLQTNNAKLSQRGRDLSVANSFAENKIEALRSQGYLAVAPGTQNVTNELPSELNSPRNATLSITTEPETMKKATLTITYNDQGSPRTYTYVTYLGEVGVGQY